MAVTFLVRCDRCGTLAEAGQDDQGEKTKPVGWADRSAPSFWTAGARAAEVIVCGPCTTYIDAHMAAAWSNAIAAPPVAAEPPGPAPAAPPA